MIFATISMIRMETKPRAVDNILSKILLLWKDFSVLPIEFDLPTLC